MGLTRGPGIGFLFDIHDKEGIGSGPYESFADSINFQMDTVENYYVEPEQQYERTKRLSLNALGLAEYGDSGYAEVTVRSTRVRGTHLKQEAIEKHWPTIEEKIKNMQERYGGEWTFIRSVYAASDFEMKVSTTSKRDLDFDVPSGLASRLVVLDSLFDLKSLVGAEWGFKQKDKVTYQVTPKETLLVGYGFEPLHRKHVYVETTVAAGYVNEVGVEPMPAVAMGIGLRDLMHRARWLEPFVGFEGARYSNGTLWSPFLENRFRLTTKGNLQLVARLGYTWADVDEMEEKERPSGSSFGIGLGGGVGRQSSLIGDIMYLRQVTKSVRRDGEIGDDLEFGQFVVRIGYRFFP